MFSRFCRCLIVTCSLLFTASAGAQLLAAGDLAQLAAHARVQRTPVLIAFMQKTCPYCRVARRDYLVPLQNDPLWRGRVLIREVDVDRGARMQDFDGNATTHRDFARKHGVQRVPTVMVFDAGGKAVAPPIIGLLTEDFYRIYIEQAVEAGLVSMRTR
ncbi:MAG: thioredoxin fold domain-containing protein [Burkholderiales bacterium]